ncbi:nodal homolog [Lingula anatina]|uniref:Nodal homolog n=1 Tax=Lingula anatina TaxID=7574 RepID=A0A1S3JWR3_LINAN|nr:nodal homolog [Lingula anatina]|eukprot:XP_013414870.1 nodal homolog [Lingula anatina]
MSYISAKAILVILTLLCATRYKTTGASNPDDILLNSNDVLVMSYTRANAKFLIDVFKNLQEGQSLPQASGHKDVEKGIAFADTIRSFSASGNQTDDDAGEVTFVLSKFHIPQEEHIRLVELRIPSHEIANDSLPKYKTDIEVSAGEKLDFIKRKRSPGRRTVNGDVVFTITPLIKKCLSSIKNITATDVYLKLRALGESASILPLSKAKEAVIVVYSEDHAFFKNFQRAANSRPARSAPESKFTGRKGRRGRKRKDRRKNRTEYKHPTEISPCTKHDFYVDFSDIGWDQWIVFPKRFNAHFCYGQCRPHQSHTTPPSNHAIMQGLVSWVHPDDVPMPCCVPTKLKPLSMLYYEHDEIVVRHHSDMVVDECGCR